MDEETPSRVDSDVAYLRDLTTQVLELNTATGRHACAEAAKHEAGRTILLDILSANERWREAMLAAVIAFDSTNALIRSALGGECVSDQPIH